MSQVEYDQLITQVPGLPYDQRFELAQRLEESLHPPGEDLTDDQWKAAWTVERRRRLAEVEAGVRGVPLEEASPRIAGRYA